MATAGSGQASHSVTPETVIAKDAGSLFENVGGAQTAADSVTNKDEFRQSFGQNNE